MKIEEKGMCSSGEVILLPKSAVRVPIALIRVSSLVLHRYVRSPFLEGSKFVLLQEGGFILLQLRDQNCDISLGVNLKVEHEVLPEKF